MRQLNHPLKLVIYLFIISSFLFLSSKCKKEPQNQTPQLPPETQTGAGTFGCLVNGKVWLATSYFVDNPAIDNIAIYGINKGFDNKGNYINQNIGISVYKSLLKEGKYYLDNEPERWANFGDVVKFCDLRTIKDTNNYLQITRYDLVNRIIAGRFQFTTLPAPQDSCDQKIITKGVFDLKL
ncbi:MAG: hypothetical protein HYR66_07195 [Sphingobacteriales bacterium]|nr:hypothetical protein [Sphingobacteriales bacterium]MBI3718162.1 hypothetical protein [Sphingobacteriales bacterium]